MRTHRRKRIKYGLISGAFAFIGGWALTTLILPQALAADFPRWRTTLWVYLGAHFVEMSDVYFGGIGLETRQPTQVFPAPNYLTYIPILAAASAAAYSCTELSHEKLRPNVSAAAAVGGGYFLAGLLAMLASDMQPGISFVLIIGLVAGAGVWLGSSFLSTLTRGIPFIGITTLGTIASVGVLLLIGGVTIISSVWGLIGLPYVGALPAGLLIGMSRQFKQAGERRNANFPRLEGLKIVIKDNWKEIIVISFIIIMLSAGLQSSDSSRIVMQ
ncbi:hypothetical protein [Haloarcula sp. H-GB5]